MTGTASETENVTAVQSGTKKRVYPETRQSDDVHKLHGEDIPDPFKWLEDPDSEETKAWVKKQNELTMPFLEGSDVRNKFKDRMKVLYNYPKTSCPFKRGKRYYQQRNTGLQNQYVMWRSDSDDLKTAKWEVFIDPNTWSNDGTVAMKTSAFTKDGRYFAYQVSESGSDWVSIRFRDTEGEEMKSDRITGNVKFSTLCWNGNDGVFYNKYPEQTGKKDGTETTKNEFHQLFYHKLGTDSSEDKRVIRFDEPEWLSGVDVSYDEEALIMTISESCEPVNQIWMAKNSKKTEDIGEEKWVKVVNNFKSEYEFIWKQGKTYFFKTTLNAPRSRIVSCEIDLDNPPADGNVEWKEVIPMHEKNVIESCRYACGKLLVIVMADCKNEAYLYNLSGQLDRKLPVPIGCIPGIQYKAEESEIFVKFMSFLSPGIIYRTDAKEDVWEVYSETKVEGVKFNDFESHQIFVDSKDGTCKVPMFAIHKKGLKLDGNNPCLIYGYGGFNIPLLPSFSITRLMFMQHFNGVVVIANIRGGGEYGQAWHHSGILAKKQNSYDDFQGCAKYLIEKKYTNRNKILITGGSNGGTLVAACANQAPELYGAVVTQVPVTDMLKFHTWTIGHCWRSDFGDPDVKDQFEVIKTWSPLHNVASAKIKADGHFPSVLVTTADHDDRVVPAHSFKYAAELQRALGPKVSNPLYIRVEVKAGHGAGKPTDKIIEECADVYSFVAQVLDLEWCPVKEAGDEEKESVEQ